MDRFDPFVKYADVYGDIINWEKDPMNKPQNQNKYFFSDGKTYYEQICKMLRLMSVFKEAFNQIYSNEDEISEAWENFVNNLSASVVEGSEPDVTLTWTDDSVNFEFTMVPGVPGEQGVGITSISFNSDYTMTITLSDGNTYTSMSLKGETGPQGPQGETGSGLQILDVYATLADLQSAHPTGQPGDAYQVGSEGNYTLYIWSSSQSAWVPAGSLGTVSPSVSNPLMDGTASAGSLNQYSRGDHVHPTDTSRASKEELDALIKTSQALIDQSFTYRESPAVQDGLAKIESIKGNTLVWNQLVTNDASASVINGVTYTKSGNKWSASGTATEVSSSQVLNSSSILLKRGHKYLCKGCPSGGSDNTYYFGLSGIQIDRGNGGIWESTYADGTVAFPRFDVKQGTTVNFTDMQFICVDLTQMFGPGNEPTTVEEFTSLFSLPYYSYNQGTLLSFMGSGLKTIGFNQWDGNSENGKWIDDYSTGAVSTAGSGYNVTDFIHVFPNTTYYHAETGSRRIMFYDGNKNPIPMTSWQYGSVAETIVSPPNAHYIRFTITNDYLSNFCFNISDQSKDGTYEPYTSSTGNLPISTYFPTGMKSKGDVYDELTPRKAITRIGTVDLGTLDWRYRGEVGQGIFSCDVASTIPYKRRISVNFEVAQYNNGGTVIGVSDMPGKANMTICLYFSTDNNSRVIYAKNTAYTDAAAFKQALSGIYLYYELATPTETDIDIDLDFRAYENGTEQILPVNGSVPSTSPIIADMTYLSIDDAMEYVLEKLANVPQNTQQILESLEDDVADLHTDVGALQPAVSALQTSVGNINTNIGQLSSTVAGHTSSISDMQSDITDLNTNLGNLEDTVTDNTSRIGTLETDLASTDGQVQSLGSSVSTLSSTVSDQGTELGEIDSIIQDISNNPVISALGSHELGFVTAYVDATLPANTGTRVTIPKPVIFPNNYTPLFIVGMSTGSYNVSICEIPHTFGNSDSVKCRVWNHGSEQTTQISVYILCMRQKQSQ